MKTIEFNVNEYVWVKLTEAGLAELKRQRDELIELFPNCHADFTPPETDEDGWSRFQIHDLMHSLAHMLTPSGELPFETTMRLEANQ